MKPSERCSQKIMVGFDYRQCARNATKDGFCKQHHPDTVTARREAQSARYNEQFRNSPGQRLKRAKDRIAALELTIEGLEERLKRRAELPHTCNKDCEGNAYQIEIRRLNADNNKLLNELMDLKEPRG